MSMVRYPVAECDSFRNQRQKEKVAAQFDRFGEDSQTGLRD